MSLWNGDAPPVHCHVLASALASGAPAACHPCTHVHSFLSSTACHVLTALPRPLMLSLLGSASWFVRHGNKMRARALQLHCRDAGRGAGAGGPADGGADGEHPARPARALRAAPRRAHLRQRNRRGRPSLGPVRPLPRLTVMCARAAACHRAGRTRTPCLLCSAVVMLQFIVSLL